MTWASPTSAFDVKPGAETTHTIPEEFQAYWIRFKSSEDCTVTALSPSFPARERLDGSRMAGLLGIVTLLLAAFALCDNRKAIRWRTVGTAFALRVLPMIIFFSSLIATMVGLFVG